VNGSIVLPKNDLLIASLPGAAAVAAVLGEVRAEVLAEAVVAATVPAASTAATRALAPAQTARRRRHRYLVVTSGFALARMKAPSIGFPRPVQGPGDPASMRMPTEKL
jgi:hypothetical protein